MIFNGKDKFGSTIIERTWIIALIFWFLCLYIPILMVAKDVTSMGVTIFLCIIATVFWLLGFKTVPPKSNGVVTWGGRIIDGYILAEGTHWLFPFLGIKTESFEQIAYIFELSNIYSYNKIEMLFKCNIRYGLANIILYIYSKNEMKDIIKNGAIKAINNEISINKLYDIEIIKHHKQFEDKIFEELDRVYKNNGTGIWEITIEWIKPSNHKILEDYINQNTFETEIKRILTIAKELDISAEDAFRIDSIRLGKISSHENVYRLSGAKEIIEAVGLLLKR